MRGLEDLRISCLKDRSLWAILPVVAIFMFMTVVLVARACEAAEPIVIDADSFEYVADRMYVIATGNVSANSGEITITADQIDADLSAQTLVAAGNVTFKKKTDSGKCDRLTYDMNSGEISFDSAHLVVDGLIIGADSATITRHDFVLDGSVVTRCDLKTPCYSVRARRIVIYPGDRLIAQRVVLYLGRYPVIPIPRLTLPLKKTEAGDSMLPQVDWDESMPHVRLAYKPDKGVIVGADYHYSIDDYSRLSIDAEYASRAGWALGFDYDYGPKSLGIVKGDKLSGHGGILWSSLDGAQAKVDLSYIPAPGIHASADLDWKQSFPTAGGIRLEGESRNYRYLAAAERARQDSGYVDAVPRIRVESMPFQMIGDRVSVKMMGEAGRFAESATGREAARATAEMQISLADPLKLTKNVSLGASMKANRRFYGTGDSAGAVDATISLAAQAGLSSQLGLDYRVVRAIGETPFSFDRQSDADELNGRFSLGAFPGWTIAWSGRYDLRTQVLVDSDWTVARHLHCFDVTVTWREKRKEFGLGVKLTR